MSNVIQFRTITRDPPEDTAQIMRDLVAQQTQVIQAMQNSLDVASATFRMVADKLGNLETITHSDALVRLRAIRKIARAFTGNGDG